MLFGWWQCVETNLARTCKLTSWILDMIYRYASLWFPIKEISGSKIISSKP